LPTRCCRCSGRTGGTCSSSRSRRQTGAGHRAATAHDGGPGHDREADRTDGVATMSGFAGSRLDAPQAGAASRVNTRSTPEAAGPAPTDERRTYKTFVRSVRGCETQFHLRRRAYRPTKRDTPASAPNAIVIVPPWPISAVTPAPDIGMVVTPGVAADMAPPWVA
jgi:hypothetical protein